MAPEKASSGSPLWDSWVDTLKAATSPTSTYAPLLEAWRKAVGVPAADEPTPAASRPAAEGTESVDGMQPFLSGQQTLQKMTELAAQTMRSFLPPGATASDADQPPSPLLGGLDLWASAAAQYHQLAEPWTDLMQRSIGIAEALGGPSGAGDPLGAALERSFGVLANFPGLNQELPALLREAAAAALALTGAREGYRVIMAATWQRAFEEITREFLRRAADGKPVDSPAGLLSLSTSVADRVFVETFNSARYIDAQRRLSNALADQRRNEAKVVDLFARLGHFPTRRDHEEVLREVGTLRREVRALKRALRKPPNVVAAPISGTAPVSRKRRRSRAKPPRPQGDPPTKNDRGE